ncbi:MFS transporter [Saccharopolyspora pogona]|uniref:MFS transporter n=1 Tax=Saccharopolyspora pogona TaxID=333966 RepID=UPI00168700BC|nr:MFS transporter [Saccharopolyspora pogona]
MPAAEPGRITVRELLARPVYRRWWAAAVISRAGDILAGVTLLLLVLDRTGSGLGVAGVVIADVVPVLLFAPVAGVVVDRLPRRRIMIAADLVRMALAALLPLVGTHLGAVYAIAFALSAAAVFFNPAANSLLPALVGERELVAANSGIWTTAIVAQIALAPLAGALAAVAGYAAAFWVNAASFAISAMLLTGLAVPGHRAATSQGWARDALDGVRLLVADRLLRSLATAQLLAALSAGATSALLVVLVRERLGLGPQGFGWLLATIAVGALAGPALLTRIARGPVRPGIVFAAYGGRGLVDVLLALTTWPLLAAAALLFYGLSTSTGTITFTSLVQTHTGEAARGRVFAGFDALFQTGRLVSLLLGGVLADWLGITAVYFCGAALLLTAAASGFSPRRSAQST